MRWVWAGTVLAGVLLAGNCAGSGEAVVGGSVENGSAAMGLAQVGNDTFPFRPRSCSADPNEFLAEGPGANAKGDEYYVIVAADEITIRLGANSSTDDGDADLPAWDSVAEPQLEADGETIKGSAVFVDSRGELLAEQRGIIEVSCDPVDD